MGRDKNKDENDKMGRAEQQHAQDRTELKWGRSPGRLDQAEHQHAEQCANSQAEQVCSLQKTDQASHAISRAEQNFRDARNSSQGSTYFTRQSPTITGAFKRYAEIPVGNSSLQVVTPKYNPG